MPMDNQLLYGFAIAMVVLVLILIGMVASLRRSLKAGEVRKALVGELDARHGEVMRRLEALEALEDKVRRSNDGVEQLRAELVNTRHVVRDLSESIRELGETRVAALETRSALVLESIERLRTDVDVPASVRAVRSANAELASSHPEVPRAPAAPAGEDKDQEEAPVPFDREDLEATVRMVGDVTAETAKKAAVVTAAAAKSAGKWLEKSWLKIKKSREEAAGPHVVEELSHPEALHDEESVDAASSGLLVAAGGHAGEPPVEKASESVDSNGAARTEEKAPLVEPPVKSEATTAPEPNRASPEVPVVPCEELSEEASADPAEMSGDAPNIKHEAKRRTGRKPQSPDPSFGKTPEGREHAPAGKKTPRRSRRGSNASKGGVRSKAGTGTADK